MFIYIHLIGNDRMFWFFLFYFFFFPLFLVLKRKRNQQMGMIGKGKCLSNHERPGCVKWKSTYRRQFEKPVSQAVTIRPLGLVKASERAESLLITDSYEEHPWFQMLAPQSQVEVRVMVTDIRGKKTQHPSSLQFY